LRQWATNRRTPKWRILQSVMGSLGGCYIRSPRRRGREGRLAQ
jgi:hypothetical protein